jgi:hypothetical protein
MLYATGLTSARRFLAIIAVLVYGVPHSFRVLCGEGGLPDSQPSLIDRLCACSGSPTSARTWLHGLPLSFVLDLNTNRV